MQQAYSYQRWSKPEQGDDEHGTASKSRQTSSAEAWIKEHGQILGYELAKEMFIGAGESGYGGKHIAKDNFGKAKGSMARFIQCVEEGKIKRDSLLLIDSWDRFSRLKPRQSFELFNSILDAGIGLVFTGTYDKRILNAKLVDDDDYILYTVIGEMIRSHKESKEKSRKVKDGLGVKLQAMRGGEIQIHTNAPKYYTFDPLKKQYLQNGKAAVVHRIVREYLDGDSLFLIAKRLNDENVPSVRYHKKQRLWSRAAVKSLLQNKGLYGEFLGIPNYFSEPVIDRPTFDKLQLQIQRNAGLRGKFSSSYINIFKGIARCAHCSDFMSIGTQTKNYKTGKIKKRPYKYLRCSRIGNGKTCVNRFNMNLAEIENELFGICFQSDPRELFGGERDAGLEAKITALQKSINALTAEIDTLATTAAQYHIEEFQSRAKELQSKREEKRAELDALNLSRGSNTADIAKFDDFRTLFHNLSSVTEDDDEAFQAAWDKLYVTLSNNELRKQLRNMLPSVVSKITFDSIQDMWQVYNIAGKVIYTGRDTRPRRLA